MLTFHPRFFARLPRPMRWAILVALSALLASLLHMAGLPAALMIGPMLAAVVLETGGGELKVPRRPYVFAQALIGCLIGRSINMQIVETFAWHWPLFLGVVAAVVLSGSVLGFILSRLKVLPGSTAVWGLLPGAATAMILMAEAYSADMRLVAFMQYSRVVMVAAVASIVAGFVIHAPGGAVAPAAWFPPLHPIPFAETMFLATMGVAIGRASRLPAGVLLITMALGILLSLTRIIAIDLPLWLMALAYGALGWGIGMRFTRQVLSHAARTLPQTLGATAIMMAFAGFMAVLLVRLMGIDPLTAYLATSPGGMDSIAVIAASSKVDLSFIMALQTTRFVFILLIGPTLSRAVARMVGPPKR
jgi:membrane AbrB-like protein